VVYALAGLQAVVTLGWMAYAYFQPILLDRFGLTAFTGPLALYLGLAGTTLAPFVGALGDRVAQRNAGRVPLIVAGGLLAGVTFVAVASTVSASPVGSVRWLLLALIALWIAAMTVLQAPALSLLPGSANEQRWPIVTSPLVVATVLPVALWPVVRNALGQLGGPPVFFAGGVAVVAAVLALRRAVSTTSLATANTGSKGADTVAQVRLMLAALAFVLGGISAFVTRLAAEVVPGLLAVNVTSSQPPTELLSAMTMGASAIFAPSLAPVAVAAGNRTSLIVSVIGAVLCVAAAPLCGSVLTAAAVAVVMGAALAMHLDCALPCAFEVLPSRRCGLSAGLYLGGIFAGSQLALLWMS